MQTRTHARTHTRTHAWPTQCTPRQSYKLCKDQKIYICGWLKFLLHKSHFIIFPEVLCKWSLCDLLDFKDKKNRTWHITEPWKESIWFHFSLAYALNNLGLLLASLLTPKHPCWTVSAGCLGTPQSSVCWGPSSQGWSERSPPACPTQSLSLSGTGSLFLASCERQNKVPIQSWTVHTMYSSKTFMTFSRTID